MSTVPRPLVLVGAGGLGRETVELVRALNAVEPTWELVGFVDDDPALAGVSVAGLPVLGPIASVVEADAAVAVCTARPAVGCSRRRIVAGLGLEPARFATLIHPRAALASSTELGPGCLVFAGVVTTASVTVGAHVVLMPQVVLTHDDRVGAFATLASGVRLGGGVEVGAEAYLAAGVLVREQLVVGQSALVGMGAVVLHDVPPGETWVGVPARSIDAAASEAAGT